MGKPAIDIGTLTRDEQLDLLDELWDHLSRQADGLPLTAEQEVELDRRLDALEREGAVGISPEDLAHRIRNRTVSGPSSSRKSRWPRKQSAPCLWPMASTGVARAGFWCIGSHTSFSIVFSITP
jgi:putative addiction module component (TIGR02574 family)